MARCQRRIALRVAAAYRTISGDALLVLVGIPPICLLVMERTEIYVARQWNENAAEVQAKTRGKVILARALALL